MAKEKEKTCFVIMPLTTPKSLISEYRDGEDHFIHVLENLFIPAIDKAGFKPIKPIAKGADLIHAGIIKNLLDADLVLCDMSILNPNVFFEYGIRTALNKPICLVRDDKTVKIPFDTNIINYHTYLSALELWNYTHEVSKLFDHIQNTFIGSKGVNELWKYFGIQTEAKAPEKASIEDKLDLILETFLAPKKRDDVLKKIKNLNDSYKNAVDPRLNFDQLGSYKKEYNSIRNNYKDSKIVNVESSNFRIQRTPKTIFIKKDNFDLVYLADIQAFIKSKDPDFVIALEN